MEIKHANTNFGMAQKTYKLGKKSIKIISGEHTFKPNTVHEKTDLLVIMPNAKVKAEPSTKKGGLKSQVLHANYIVALKNAVLENIQTYSKKFTYLRKVKKTGLNVSTGGIRTYKCKDVAHNMAEGKLGSKVIKSNVGTNISIK